MAWDAIKAALRSVIDAGLASESMRKLLEEAKAKGGDAGDLPARLNELLKTK